MIRNVGAFLGGGGDHAYIKLGVKCKVENICSFCIYGYGGQEGPE